LLKTLQFFQKEHIILAAYIFNARSRRKVWSSTSASAELYFPGKQTGKSINTATTAGKTGKMRKIAKRRESQI